MKDLEDIFGFSSGQSESTAASSAASANPIPPTAAADLFGGSNTNGVGGLGSANSVPLRDTGDAFHRVCTAADGVLYQDQWVQIGFKAEFSKGMGRMMLFYGNVSNQPLDSFTTSVTDIPSLSLNLQPLRTTIEPRAQVQQLLAMTCTGQFSDPPLLQLSFNAGGSPMRFAVKLPIVLSRFVDPQRMSAPEFFQKWKELDSPALSEQLVLKAKGGTIDMSVLQQQITGLRFALLQGVDPNTNNLVAAGTFQSSQQQVVCLVRLETNPSHAMYRLSLRTYNEGVTATLKKLLTSQLSE